MAAIETKDKRQDPHCYHQEKIQNLYVAKLK